jgi:hypothetical protein
MSKKNTTKTNTEVESEVEQPKEKTFLKSAFLKSAEYRNDAPLLAILLIDGERYTKHQVVDVLVEYKNKEVINNG